MGKEDFRGGGGRGREKKHMYACVSGAKDKMIAK